MQFERFYGLNHSVVLAWFAHLYHLLISLFFRGNVCCGNGVSVQPYVHPQQMEVFKHIVYV
jgi:hypothetical protein